MIGAFIPGEVAERGGDIMQLGLIMLAPLLSLVAVCYPAYRYVQSHGALCVLRRGLLLGAILPFANATIGKGLSGTSFTAWFVFTRLLDGVAQGLVEVSGLSMLLRRAHGCERVTISIGLVECVRSLASVVGPIVGGIAYQTGLGGGVPTREPKWYAVSGFVAPFMIAGVTSATAAALATYCLDVQGLGEDDTSRARRQMGDARSLMRMPLLWLVAAIHAYGFATVGLLEACFAPYVLAPPFNASLTWVGAHMTLGSFGLAVAALATAAISAQCGAGMLAQIAAGEWMQALGLLTLAICVSSADAALAYTLACCGAGLAIVNSASLVTRLVATFESDPRHLAESLAALYIANYAIGYGGGSQLAAILTRAIGFRVTASSFAAFAALTPLSLCLLRPACLRHTLADGRALFDRTAQAAMSALEAGVQEPDDKGDKGGRGRRGAIRIVWGVWRWTTLPAEGRKVALFKKGAASVA